MRGPSSLLMPAAIASVTITGCAIAFATSGYAHLVLSLVALTTIVGVGLNILLGLGGQISLGHVGFYAIGAYAVAILTLHGVNFWLALAAATLLAGALGGLLALPALRVKGPYLAMVTIAFAFIVQHVIIEWKDLTGGQNGLMGLPPPSLGGVVLGEREMALLSVVLAGAALAIFARIAGGNWGKAMVAVRDSEVAARSLGLNPVVVKTMAFALSAAFTGLAGGVFAPLMMFIAPDSFPFSQSILFLLAVMVGGAGWVFGPLVGAIVTVMLPELLSGLAEYRLLMFGALLLAVLWLAPEGVIGSLARLGMRFVARSGRPTTGDREVDLGAFLRASREAPGLVVRDVGLSFGGIRAASGVTFTAPPRAVTSIIGPNGAGKTTVLNIVSGFYRPETGSVALGAAELAGASAWRVARAGITRTYQTTQLFESMTVIENVLIALRGGRLRHPFSGFSGAAERDVAETLLAFVGYRGACDVPAGDLAHVDRRLVEIARALATRPRVLLLDEPAAGLMRADKTELSGLLRRIADFGIAVILVEHDMAMVMGISDHVVVLDAGTVIAASTPDEVRHEPQVLAAYLGDAGLRARPRVREWTGSRDAVLACVGLSAGYGAAPVLDSIDIDICEGEMVALLGANGAGKSTAMRAISGLLRPVDGNVLLDDASIGAREAHSIAYAGLALVPEGRQVFAELSVYDNILLGAYTRGRIDRRAEAEAVLKRFPRLRERIDSRAGLLSGGEQQMLAIARALMAKPRVLLLDEPSLGLSPAMVNELFDILAELRDEGVTILLVDQMAALALTVADRGYVLEAGRVVRAGTAQELAGDPALEAAYLGHSEAAE